MRSDRRHDMPGKKAENKAFALFGQIFDADLRSLAAFRIAMSIIVLIDLVGKASNLTVFFTDEGALPRRILLAELRPWSISLHMMNGTFLVEALLFAATGAAAIAMLLGYRTRVASVLVWAMVLSTQWRNPFLLHGADELLRVVLFWGMFLPLGARWSIDSRKAGNSAAISNRFVSVGVAGLFLQIAFVYWFAVLLKTGKEWREDGTALYYALSSEGFISPIGIYMQQYYDLLKVLSFGALGIEAIAPFLMLSPFLKGPLRTIGVMLLMSLHFGILITMNIGWFPLLSAFSTVCFLPAWFWDSVVPRGHVLLTRIPTYEQLAERFAAIPRRFGEVAGSYRFAAMRRAYVSFASAGSPPASISPPATFRVSESQRHGGEGDADVRRTSRLLRLGSTPALNLLAAFFVVYISVMNVTTVSSYTMPAPNVTLPMAVALGLDQRWAMYSPTPAQFTYWFTVPGVMKDGTTVDLLPAVMHQDPERTKPVSFEKPENVNETYRDIYWLRFMTTLTMPTAEQRLLHFGGYVCRSWNEWHPDGPMQLQAFDIVYFTQATLPEGQRGEVESRVVWKHRCR